MSKMTKYDEASVFLKRAILLDNNKEYSRALSCYSEGIELLFEYRNSIQVKETKKRLRSKAIEYLDRSEQLKENIKKEEEKTNQDQNARKSFKKASDLEKENQYVAARARYIEGIGELMEFTETLTGSEMKLAYKKLLDENIRKSELLDKKIEAEKDKHFKIEKNSRGHTYETIFGRYLDNKVTSINIDEPWLHDQHQVENFLRFCELCAVKCGSLKSIFLQTKTYTDEEDLKEIRKILSQRNISLSWKFYPPTELHDREICLDNGWVIKIGRGLDIYLPAEGEKDKENFSLRKCRDASVDIFRR